MKRDDQRSVPAELQPTVAVSLGRPRPRTHCVGWLVVVRGEQVGTDFRLVPGRNTIGTAADCEVVLTDPYVSQRHASLTYRAGELRLVDLDSSNYTFVNDVKITSTGLIDNDRIRVGRTILRFKTLPEAEQPGWGDIDNPYL